MNLRSSVFICGDYPEIRSQKSAPLLRLILRELGASAVKKNFHSVLIKVAQHLAEFLSQ